MASDFCFPLLNLSWTQHIKPLPCWHADTVEWWWFFNVMKVLYSLFCIGLQVKDSWKRWTVNNKVSDSKMTWVYPQSSVQFSSVAQSCPTLQPRESQHARPPCPSPTPRVHPNPYPLRQWCHPTISSSVVPFFSCPQSFRASGSFKRVSSLH